MTVLTAAPPEAAERLLSWKRALSRALARVEVTTLDPEGWTGSLTTCQFGALRIGDETGGAATVVRDPASVVADPRRHVLARLQLTGTVRVAQAGRSAELTPGTLGLLDLGRPFRISWSEPQRARLLVLPRPLLGLDDRALHHVTAVRFGGAGDGPDGLLLPLLTGIAEEILVVAPAVQDRLARTAADLLAVIAADLAVRLQHTRPAAPSLFDRITDSVEASLGDPGLTPQQLADRHGVSLRYLHQLFQRQGTTVGSWIRTRRLHGAHQELARPGAVRREIAAVAARWGFTSASHFSRAFRETYGMSPLDWRTRAGMRAEPAGAARTGK